MISPKTSTKSRRKLDLEVVKTNDGEKRVGVDTSEKKSPAKRRKDAGDELSAKIGKKGSKVALGRQKSTPSLRTKTQSAASRRGAAKESLKPLGREKVERSPARADTPHLTRIDVQHIDVIEQPPADVDFNQQFLKDQETLISLPDSKAKVKFAHQLRDKYFKSPVGNFLKIYDREGGGLRVDAWPKAAQTFANKLSPNELIERLESENLTSSAMAARPLKSGWVQEKINNDPVMFAAIEKLKDEVKASGELESESPALINSSLDIASANDGWTEEENLAHYNIHKQFLDDLDKLATLNGVHQVKHAKQMHADYFGNDAAPDHFLQPFGSDNVEAFDRLKDKMGRPGPHLVRLLPTVKTTVENRMRSNPLHKVAANTRSLEQARETKEKPTEGNWDSRSPKGRAERTGSNQPNPLQRFNTPLSSARMVRRAPTGPSKKEDSDDSSSK